MNFPVLRTNSLLRRRNSRFAAKQGIASKALRLLREMTVRLAKMGKKGRVFANFSVLFPVFRESGPHAFSSATVRLVVDNLGMTIQGCNTRSIQTFAAAGTLLHFNSPTGNASSFE
jgi:hypothetical protein